MTVRFYPGSNLGGGALNNADMKASDTTQYSTGTLPAPRSFIFNAVITIVNVGGGAAGEAKLTLDSLDSDGNVIKTLDIVATIPTNAAGTTVCDLIFGAGTTAELFGVGVLDADANKFKIMDSFRLILEVVTANDGTSSFATMTLAQEA